MILLQVSSQPHNNKLTRSSILYYPRSFQAEYPAKVTQYTKLSRSTGPRSNQLLTARVACLPEQQQKSPGRSASSQSCNANSLSRVVGMLLLQGRRIEKAGSYGGLSKFVKPHSKYSEKIGVSATSIRFRKSSSLGGPGGGIGIPELGKSCWWLFICSLILLL